MKRIRGKEKKPCAKAGRKCTYPRAWMPVIVFLFIRKVGFGQGIYERTHIIGERVFHLQHDRTVGVVSHDGRGVTGGDHFARQGGTSPDGESVHGQFVLRRFALARILVDEFIFGVGGLCGQADGDRLLRVIVGV